MYLIMIIEDDPSYQSMMETILILEGFDVKSASDGQSGLAMLREHRPDLILCDIMMPLMDGHAVLGSLRKEKQLLDVPFIFVTALGHRTDVRHGMTAGADDYLPKPFSAEELIVAVTGCLTRRENLRKHYLSSIYQEECTILVERTTVREREILELVGRGATSREIAGHLGISLRTVDAHRTNLMNKLGAENAAMLSRWALIADQLREQLATPTVTAPSKKN